jgi:hypothetical protein
MGREPTNNSRAHTLDSAVCRALSLYGLESLDEFLVKPGVVSLCEGFKPYGSRGWGSECAEGLSLAASLATAECTEVNMLRNDKYL